MKLKRKPKGTEWERIRFELPYGFLIWLTSLYSSGIFDLTDKGNVISLKSDEVKWNRETGIVTIKLASKPRERYVHDVNR